MADFLHPGPLPVAAKGMNSTGWWGMLCLIATEASLFAYLLFSYYYLAVQRGPAWSPDPHPSLTLSGPDTLVLIFSSVVAWWGEQGAKRGEKGRLLLGLGGAILLGVTFLVVQYFEWKSKGYSLSSGSYGSLFFTITGFHMAHVIVGVLLLSAVFVWSALDLYTVRRHEPISNVITYWHFVDAVWLAVFSTFYLSPYVMGWPA